MPRFSAACRPGVCPASIAAPPLLRRITMTRQNLFSDLWDGENEELGTKHQVFWRPEDARMGATLYEFAPGSTGGRLHMHFGAEEMFFVLSGRPTFRNQHGEE